MRKRHRTFWLATFVLIVTSAAAAQSTISADPVLSSEGDPKTWERFTSGQGRFSILFPGSPTTSEESKSFQNRTYVVHKSQLRHIAAEYEVIYADYPKYIVDVKPADVLLGEAARDKVAEFNSRLLSIKPTSVGGYPGRVLKQRLRNGFFTEMKLVLVGQRLYRAAITMQEEDQDKQLISFQNWLARKFLDSFELYSPPTTAVETSSGSVRACPPDITNCIYVTEPLNGSAIRLPQPPVPPIARTARVSGLVEVLVVVDESGDVIRSQSISGHPLLQAAAAQAATRAKFTPLTIAQVPVRFSGVLQYKFVLD